MITEMVITFVIIFVVSYLIGSIPTGYLIVKLLKGEDIRETGSGSTGATNVKRVLGTKWFFIVMLIDALKGIIPVLIAVKYYDYLDFIGLGPIIAALGVVIGHSKSVFLKFSGGKSVATGIGTLIALYPPVGLIIAGVWAIVTFYSKYVSLGSVVAISMAPVLMNAFGQNVYYICYAAACAIFVIIMHRENIKRLIQGNENKVRK